MNERHSYCFFFIENLAKCSPICENYLPPKDNDKISSPSPLFPQKLLTELPPSSSEIVISFSQLPSI